MDPLTSAAAISGAAAIAGGLINDRSNRRQASADRAMQREFAQYGIRWRVEDAKKAGIHPAVALGASVNGAQPTQIGSQIGDGIERAGRAYLDAKLQSEVTQSDLNQAQINETDSRTALNVEQLNSMKLDAISRGNIRPLYKLWKDNVTGMGKVWVIDEEAAQGMQGTIPTFMTIKANGEAIYGGSIEELKSQMKQTPKYRTRGQRKHGGR